MLNWRSWLTCETSDFQFRRTLRKPRMKPTETSWSSRFWTCKIIRFCTCLIRGWEPTGWGTALLKGPGSQSQTKCKPAVCSHCGPDKLHTRVYKQEHGQQNKGSYYSLLLGTGKTTPGTLRPVVEGWILEGRPVQRGCWETGEKHKENYQNYFWHMTHKQRLRQLGLFSLVKRQLKGKLTTAYNYFEGKYKNDRANLSRVRC